jgi:release factor glutamine methyltransferase
VERFTVADIGTGCGNIAVSVALGTELARVLACDISPAAVEVAKENVLRYGLQDRVTVLCGDLFAPLCELGYKGKLDLVVCNPPYIPTSSLENLAPEVIDYEPRVALDAGAYGIDIFRRLILDSVAMLRPGGTLVFEIGAGQDKLVTRLLQRGRAYTDIQHYDDGVDVRVISAMKRTDGSTQATNQV